MARTKKAVWLLAMPAHWLSRLISRIYRHDPIKGRIVVGVGLMVTGSFLATYDQHIVPHVLQDALAYCIHGIGAAPLAEKVLAALE